jgi:protein-disulfide isomerase
MGSVRKARPRRAKRQSSRNTPYIIGAIIAVGAVVTVVLIGALARGGDGSPSGAIVVPTERPAAVAEDGHTIGDPSATVTITEYLDFQCPFCRRTAVQIMPVIEQEFIESGVAKLEIRPIAILGSESVRSAAAAECAAAQGEFFAFHDILYANQSGEGQGAFRDSRLKEFAAALDLDMSAFNACFDASTYDDQVAADTAAAAEAGVRSTPTILVDGVEVDADIEAISAAIRQASGS